MVARLWWKEARMFWPIWVFLVVVAVAVQMFALQLFGKDVRDGSLAVLALAWTCFHAFAVAAASFAGERESGTLSLLDSLPIDRWRLWMTKFSFAVFSTLGLGLVFLGIAAIGSTRFAFSEGGFLFGVVAVLEVLGWGLFWSAFLSNALAAAALAVCSTGLAMPVVAVVRGSMSHLNQALGIHLALAVVTTIASAGLFILLGPPRRTLFSRSRVAKSRRSTLAESGHALPVSLFAPGVHSTLRLVWQALRQLNRVWWWMLALALFMPVSLSFWNHSPDDAIYWLLFLAGTAIVAGVIAFGVENAGRTYQFLAHHGARPSLVWLVRMAVWGPALGILLGLAALGIWQSGRSERIPFEAIAVVWFLALAVGVFCGMVIRRGITAGVVSVLFLLALAIPGGILTAMGMLPSWVLLAVPTLILLVSFVWAGEWMFDRPRAVKWLKLCALLVIPFAALFAVYVLDRVFSVPTLDPVHEAKLFDLPAPAKVPANQNAAELYRQAGASLTAAPADMYKALETPWDRIPNSVKIWYRDNTKGLDLLRQAAAKPYCQFAPVTELTAFNVGPTEVPELSILFNLVSLSIREQMALGNLDGAWKDIVVLLRMIHHWGETPLRGSWFAVSTEPRALGLAMTWAAHAKQTPERLRAALAAYRGVPRPDAVDAIRAEALIVENTYRLPRDKLVDEIRTMMSDGSHSAPGNMESLWTEVATTPWELARARRSFRLLFASRIVQARLEPWFAGTVNSSKPRNWTKLALTDSPNGQVLPPDTLEHLERTTPLIRVIPFPTAVESYLRSWWRNETGRRALVQLFALRIWQLTHDGALPDNLDELVIDHLIPSLPTDPYTSRPRFGYIRATGQKLLPLGLFRPVNEYDRERETAPVENARLLYSVGPDGIDNRAEKNDRYDSPGDIIFPLAEKPDDARQEATGAKP